MHRLRPLIYAAFLAASWTWCIGMYLPVLLLRDYGPWSFLVFAIPNCLGAAAMGVFLWRPAASQRFLANHYPACRAFSFVTILFQMWFTLSLIEPYAPKLGLTIGLAAVVGLILGIFAVRPSLTFRAGGSLAAFACSIALGAWWLSNAGRSVPPPLPVPLHSPADLAALAPVCVFGFALSPYLDLTFHAARQSVQGPAGSRTFLVAFLVLFPAMIVLTFLYARHALAIDPVHPFAALAPPILAHVILQASFTTVIHGPGLRPDPTDKSRRIPVLASFAVAIPPALATILSMLPPDLSYKGLAPFELIYRAFMAFYALVFPSYVLIACVGADGFRGPPSRRTLLTFALAVAAAAPCFWLGFIERQPLFLLPGVLIPFLARATISVPK
ncbi:MAG: hypothetical protein HBSAPP03_12290 [Phycisphaerae bacterium]|nr:MAG: hypothetical protein HBSAPP03_12290 [Phycisphaerae bacterium]